ncbi:hypothetical protein FHQ08_12440 [Lactobacillus sp. CC-MHH1034]|uniref:YopX family protein n=1 Tax=Agrilactobacillus fermenti TaxID=2586909 RepID=UPI001E530BF5|nr:YopX family protein [Agrilactobacillus fermenti]MCD2257494.1 hypothetical protein [Agrilactobacillus fermenti]
MRDIKFREWDSEREKMYGKGHGMSYSEREEYDDSTGFRFAHEEDLDYTNRDKVGDKYYRRLMQYTGLKDGNGKEIYEGDVILIVSKEEEDSYIAPVKYFAEDNYPAFDLDPRYIPDNWYYDSNVLSQELSAGVSHVKVVGNIYENPELVEDNK